MRDLKYLSSNQTVLQAQVLLEDRWWQEPLPPLCGSHMQSYQQCVNRQDVGIVETSAGVAKGTMIFLCCYSESVCPGVGHLANP